MSTEQQNNKNENIQIKLLFLLNKFKMKTLHDNNLNLDLDTFNQIPSLNFLSRENQNIYTDIDIDMDVDMDMDIDLEAEMDFLKNDFNTDLSNDLNNNYIGMNLDTFNDIKELEKLHQLPKGLEEGSDFTSDSDINDDPENLTDLYITDEVIIDYFSNCLMKNNSNNHLQLNDEDFKNFGMGPQQQDYEINNNIDQFCMNLNNLSLNDHNNSTNVISSSLNEEENETTVFNEFEVTDISQLLTSLTLEDIENMPIFSDDSDSFDTITFDIEDYSELQDDQQDIKPNLQMLEQKDIAITHNDNINISQDGSLQLNFKTGPVDVFADFPDSPIKNTKKVKKEKDLSWENTTNCYDHKNNKNNIDNTPEKDDKGSSIKDNETPLKLSLSIEQTKELPSETKQETKQMATPTQPDIKNSISSVSKQPISIPKSRSRSSSIPKPVATHRMLPTSNRNSKNISRPTFITTPRRNLRSQNNNESDKNSNIKEQDNSKIALPPATPMRSTRGRRANVSSNDTNDTNSSRSRERSIKSKPTNTGIKSHHLQTPTTIVKRTQTPKIKNTRNSLKSLSPQDKPKSRSSRKQSQLQENEKDKEPIIRRSTRLNNSNYPKSPGRIFTPIKLNSNSNSNNEISLINLKTILKKNGKSLGLIIDKTKNSKLNLSSITKKATELNIKPSYINTTNYLNNKNFKLSIKDKENFIIHPVYDISIPTSLSNNDKEKNIKKNNERNYGVYNRSELREYLIAHKKAMMIDEEAKEQKKFNPNNENEDEPIVGGHRLRSRRSLKRESVSKARGVQWANDLEW